MNPTNIRYANAFALKVPLIKPMLMSGTRITHAETLIVRIEANNGVIGWGETTAAPSHGGQSLEEMHRIFSADRLPAKAPPKGLQLFFSWMIWFVKAL